MQAGVNVFRLNFSHGTQQEQAERISAIRDLEDVTGRPTCILADLQGPKHRIGKMADCVVLAAGDDVFTFDQSDETGDGTRACLPHPEIFSALTPGARLLIDDGKLVLRVTKIATSSFETMVEVGGPLSSRKGVNLPDMVIDSPPLTEKDRSDLAFALDAGVDWVALSFVQRASDILDAKAMIDGRGGADGEDRKTVGAGGVVGHHRGGGWHHGGTRRSWRRTAARSRAGMAEEHHQRMPDGRQAGRRGDADAGIDDREPDPDKCRGVRRCRRRV